MNKLDAALGVAAKQTLKANPNLTFTLKCQRGLAAGEKAMTVLTFSDGSTRRLWNHASGRAMSAMARKTPVAKVQHVIAGANGHGDVLRVTATYTLGDGFALVPAMG